ncbi:unnamed protein product [Rhizophagus irregularis]|uniref:Voltage-gated hydrogen channel 1 n=1 Tax=Rhizophagus irregularis TaxID=588596 RepID=A0A2I1GEE6_9GLOM|nr:hypothetical protein RhiirA4_515318 [Rhizophagus irregularis]CAB4408676.1 unnamed protein product [Rhizophagus irregularis]
MNYGTISSIPTNSSRSTELMNRDRSKFRKKIDEVREKLARKFESRQAHWIILGLVAADFISVFSVIIVSFLWPEFEEKEHIFFEVLEYIAFTINFIFVIEVTLKLFIFGIRYFIKDHHWQLHLFDAGIIITTFLLDFFLKGKQREVAGLLILFRLWRLIKALSTVAVGIIEYDEDKVDNLKSQVIQLKEELKILLTEIDKMAKEENWDEQKRARVFKSHQVFLLSEDIGDDVNVNLDV